MRIHPYALIIGIGIGIMVFASLRHPVFSILAAIISIVLLDQGYKSNSRDDGGNS